MSRGGTLAPGGSGTSIPLDAFIDFYALERDANDERVVWHAPTLRPPHAIADHLSVGDGLVERRECRRQAYQAVWSSDETLIVVALVGSRLSVEIWATTDGFHGRLDELALVAPEALDGTDGAPDLLLAADGALVRTEPVHEEAR